jgi:hypothetical protein
VVFTVVSAVLRFFLLISALHPHPTLPVPLHRTGALVLISEAAEARRLRNRGNPIKYYISYSAVAGTLERAFLNPVRTANGYSGPSHFTYSTVHT